MKKLNYHLRIEDFLLLNKNCNIYCYDLNHKFICANKNLIEVFNELMGYRRDMDIIDKTPTEIHQQKGMEVVIQENNQVISTGKVMQFLNRVNFNNRRSMIFLTIKAPMYDDEKKIAGVFGVSQLLSIYDIELRIPVKLTKREQECLTLLMRGKTAKEVAVSLNLSIRTIESYLNNLKYKFNCLSKSQLLKKAYELGLSTHCDITTSEPFNLGIFMPYEGEE